MKPYSKDLRIRVLAAAAAVDGGGGSPREEVAKTFSVLVPSSIKRWLKRRRETGDVAPRPIPGRAPVKGAALEEWLSSHPFGLPVNPPSHTTSKKPDRRRAA